MTGLPAVSHTSSHDRSHRGVAGRHRRAPAPAAPVLDVAPRLAGRRPGAGRRVRGLRTDDAGALGRAPARRARRRRPPSRRRRRADARRPGLGDLPHRRQLPGRLDGVRAGAAWPRPQRHRHRPGRRLGGPLDRVRRAGPGVPGLLAGGPAGGAVRQRPGPAAQLLPALRQRQPRGGESRGLRARHGRRVRVHRLPPAAVERAAHRHTASRVSTRCTSRCSWCSAGATGSCRRAGSPATTSTGCRTPRSRGSTSAGTCRCSRHRTRWPTRSARSCAPSSPALRRDAG